MLVSFQLSRMPVPSMPGSSSQYPSGILVGSSGGDGDVCDGSCSAVTAP